MTSLTCNLGAFDARERHRYGQLREAIHAAKREARELADGYRFNLGTASEAFLATAEWIVLEHRCCRLSVTGPEGVKAFLGEAMLTAGRHA